MNRIEYKFEGEGYTQGLYYVSWLKVGKKKVGSGSWFLGPWIHLRVSLLALSCLFHGVLVTSWSGHGSSVGLVHRSVGRVMVMVELG